MKETIAKYKDTYQQLPQLPTMKKLWHAGYWDGALSGVCEVDDKKCWFELVEEWLDNNSYPDKDSPEYDDFEAPWYRRFLIVELTPEQYQELESRHNVFRKMVGTHCDYNDDGERGSYAHVNGITEETTRQYYVLANTWEPLVIEPASDAHVLGWHER